MTSGKGVDDLINTLIKKKVLKKGLFNHGQDIVIAFSPPVVGCFVKKGFQKGITGTPGPPWLRLCFWVTVPKEKNLKPLNALLYYTLRSEFYQPISKILPQR